MAEERGVLGCLTKLGIDEDTLNNIISEKYFSFVPFFCIDTGSRMVSPFSGACDIIFWSEAANFYNWDGADTEDQPENTIVTEPYLTGIFTYVVLAGSPEAALSEE